MRIPVAFELRRLSQLLAVNSFSDWEDGFAFTANTSEVVSHATFQHEATIEHHVCCQELLNVVPTCSKEVRIDAFSDQSIDVGSVSGNDSDDVGDHGNRRDNVELPDRVGMVTNPAFRS